MQNQFDNHQLVMHDDSFDCFKSLVFFLKKAVFHIPHCNITLFPDFAVLLFQGFENVFILLTYRSNNFNVQDFIGQITHLITLNKIDFNFNALRDLPLLYTLREYCDTSLTNTYNAWATGPCYANLFGKVSLQMQSVYYSDNDVIISIWSI